MSTSEGRWTIDDLGELVARALSVGYSGQSNGQVRDVPDRRTIRYYSTLGLIDRPARMRGRTALYGRRHLMQLVAIKRLQSSGRSLTEIQQQLLGLNSAALEELARLPAGLELSPDRSPPEAGEGAMPERPAGPFWSAPTAPISSHPIPKLHSLELSDDVALLLTTSEPLPGEVVEAIRSAAEPLLHLLETRRLIRPRQKRGNR